MIAERLFSRNKRASALRSRDTVAQPCAFRVAWKAALCSTKGACLICADSIERFDKRERSGSACGQFGALPHKMERVRLSAGPFRRTPVSFRPVFSPVLKDSLSWYNPRMPYHLAQINIGRLIAPIDDPKIAEFVAQLDPINALADAAPGFVWRLKSESGNATDIAYNDDPFVIVNMSVWESP